MKKIAIFVLLAVALTIMLVGCDSGSFDPNNSIEKHQLNSGRIIPAVDHDQVVHVVRGGVPTSLSVGEVAKVRLYWKPNWDRSEASFSEGEMTMPGAPQHGEGTFSFITKSGEELWSNLDHTLCNGAPCKRSKDDLAIW